jgi:hypothetical protein
MTFNPNNFDPEDHICNLTIEQQEKFYSEIFGINIDFSNLKDKLKKTNISSGENIIFFNSPLLDNEKLNLVSQDVLKIINSRPDINRTKARFIDEVRNDSDYLIAVPKNNSLNFENAHLTLRERKILEIYLVTQRNKRLSDYFDKIIVCKGTTVYNDGKIFHPYLCHNDQGNRYYYNYIDGIKTNYGAGRFSCNNAVFVS